MIFSREIEDPTIRPRRPSNKLGRTVGLVFHTPKFYKRRISYKGYMYWVGPRRRYEFYYMGHPGYGPPHGVFRRYEHKRYVRWF